MRMPWQAVAAGAAVAVLGVGGLVRGAMPQAASASSPSAGTPSEPIVVSGAYMHPPLVPNDTAIVYFTVDNNTAHPDRLVSVQSGAGGVPSLHTLDRHGSMHTAADGMVIPAHGTLALGPGKGHVMIERVYAVHAGQTVNLELDFARAGSIDIAVPVVAYGKSAPEDHSHHHPSGGHS